jgi:hypothetical protein
MKVFFGAAIQGVATIGDRQSIYETILTTLKDMGHSIMTEHARGKTKEEIIALEVDAIGELPENELERRIYVRDKMVEFVESDIDIAIFEVSTPSLGTGIEFAHAYLRPRMGLKEIPIIALYQEGHWQNKLTTMIRGMTKETFPNLTVIDYSDEGDLVEKLNKEIAQYS